MKIFKEKIENSWQELRSKKIATWTNFVIRILILVFLIMIIRFFASPNTDKFRNFLSFWKTNQVEKEVINTP